jgi:hypothetical protein
LFLVILSVKEVSVPACTPFKNNLRVPEDLTAAICDQEPVGIGEFIVFCTIELFPLRNSRTEDVVLQDNNSVLVYSKPPP